MAAGPEVAAKVTPAGRMSAGDDGLQESLQESLAEFGSRLYGDVHEPIAEFGSKPYGDVHEPIVEFGPSRTKMFTCRLSNLVRVVRRCSRAEFTCRFANL